MRILVVEDDEQVRVLAEALLEDGGHDTLSAATAQQALALIQDEHRVEHVLLDYRQRVWSSELCRDAEVRQRRDRGVHAGVVAAVPDPQQLLGRLGVFQSLDDELVKRVEELFAVRVRPRRVAA